MSDDGMARLRSIGVVRRARGYRLYTNDGRRLLDLFQDGGWAILGHGNSEAVREARNAAERGLTTRLASPYHDRLVKAVRVLLPDAAVVRVYRNADRAMAILSEWLGRPVTTADVADPAMGQQGKIALWRPFLPASHAARILLPVLPAAGDSPPQVVVVDADDAPPSDLVAPYRLAALSRATYDLARASAPEPLDLPGFTPSGPYLIPTTHGAAYGRWFEFFLSEGVLLSPWDTVPSIIPAERSPGETALLRRVAAYAVQSEAHHG